MTWFVRWTFVALLVFPGLVSAHDCIDSSCARERITITGQDDVAHALSDLSGNYASGLLSSQQCHGLAHQLGRHAFDVSGVSAAGLKDAHACRSGFIHGLFERAVLRTDSSNLSFLCVPFDSGTTARSLNCLHGLGHGMYSRFEDVRLSLAYCVKTGGPTAAKVCAGGVFMDAFLGGHTDRPADADDSDPFVFCQRFDFAEACFRYSVLGTSRRHPSSTISVKDCDDAPPGFSVFCRQGVGAFSAKWNDYSPSSIIASCSDDSTCMNAAAFESGFSGEAFKGSALCLSTGMVGLIPCWTHLVGGYSYYWGG